MKKTLLLAAITAAASALLYKRYNDPDVVAMRDDKGLRRGQ